MKQLLRRFSGVGAGLALALVGSMAFATTPAPVFDPSSVDLSGVTTAVTSVLGVGIAIVIGRAIYRMARKGTGEATV